MNEHEHSQDNPYAAPQTPLQWGHANGDPWRTPRARTSYFAVAFRITLVLSIIGILWMGIGLMLSGLDHGRFKQFFTLGILAIYVFMACLIVMMVLCSLVVGVDLILQYLGLRSPPLIESRFQRVEPDASFFTELAKQKLESSPSSDPL